MVVNIILSFMSFMIAMLYQYREIPKWTGIGIRWNKSVTIDKETNPKTQQITKINKKTTETFQPAKTLWDWLPVGGTIGIPIALLYFERREQKRSEKKAEEKQQISENNLRERALEDYIDKISEILINKELPHINNADPEKFNELNLKVEIVRTRTLLVLQRLHKDSKRKGRVIQFLYNTKLIASQNFNNNILTDFDLSGVDLSGVDLSDFNLSGVVLKNVKLSGANLSNTDLSGANLSDANLSNTDLSGANLSGAELSSAKFVDADLSSANLSGASFNDTRLSGAKLEKANLNKAKFTKANLSGADFTAAKIKEANFSGADFTAAKIIDIDSNNIENARFRNNRGISSEVKTKLTTGEQKAIFE